MKTNTRHPLFLAVLFSLVLRSFAAAQTVVSLTFDDGLSSAPTAAQILDKYGMKGTFYIISGVLGTDAYYMTVAQVQAIQADGHEIGGHTISHPDLPTLSSAQQQHEICDGRTQLIGMGFQPVSFAYPYGDATSATETIVKSCGYTSGRGAWDCNLQDNCSDTEPIPPLDPYWIRTPEAIVNTTTLAQMKQYVTNAENSGGGWVVLQFHQVCTGGSCDQYSVTSSNLDSLLSWLQARAGQGTIVKTVAQVMGGGAVSNPLPVIASLNPSTTTAGGPAFVLTVNGSHFINGSTVRWKGSARTTTFVSSTSLRASISASDIVSAGTATVTVFTPAPGGGTSGALTFTIGLPQPPPNPVPVLTSISPSSSTAGGAAFTLIINGSNFISSSTVRWNGSVRPATFVNNARLTASISASDIATVGVATVTVVNPTPGGGTSGNKLFTINAPQAPPNPLPTILSITPSSATTGSPAFTLSVNGSNFISSSTVRWNGSNRTTTLLSSTTLIASIPVGDLGTAGTAAVTVFNPAPGGGTSGGVTFTINASSIPSSGPSTIWGNTAPAVGQGWKDTSPLEIGVRFRSDAAGYITGIRFYKWSFSTGVHSGHLWTNTGTLLASVTFTGETASGWQTAYFATPVAITANTTYVASYFTTTGYAATTNYFTVGVDNAPLHALRSGVDGLNGLYLYGASSAFPSQSTVSSNYWVDVVYNTTPTHAASLSFLPPSVSSDTAPAFTDFSQVREYPNPWRSDRPNNGFITFDQLPLNSTVKIFTVSAHWVRTLDASSGSVRWDLKNDSGEPVASGYYVYLIMNGEGGKMHGTLAVIR